LVFSYRKKPKKAGTEGGKAAKKKYSLGNYYENL